MRITAPFPRTHDRAGVKKPASRLRWLMLPVLLAIVAALALWWLPARLAPAPAVITATVGQGNLTISA